MIHEWIDLRLPASTQNVGEYHYFQLSYFRISVMFDDTKEAQ
jgi:hypothetical protein